MFTFIFNKGVNRNELREWFSDNIERPIYVPTFGSRE